MMYNQINRAARRMRMLALVPAMLVAAAVNHPAGATTNGATASEKKVAAATSGKVVAVAKGTEKSASAQEAPARWPEFPGGEEAMFRYMAFAVQYPKEAYEAGVQGKVVVGFTVAADGKVTDVSVAKSVMPALDAEAMRVVSEMPAWTPAADKDGNAVACRFALPVSFKLSGDKKTKDNPKPDMTLDEVVVVSFDAAKKTSVAADGKPTYFINGKLFEGNLDDIKPEDIKSISVRKDDPAYPNGRIEIELK